MVLQMNGPLDAGMRSLKLGVRVSQNEDHGRPETSVGNEVLRAIV